ncbi:rhodanese-like domain-containing protein [Haliea sp. AH-315-K21]|nr:rhodanese-like domain-containing protein [Haliea sp. AH-315-K21]
MARVTLVKATIVTLCFLLAACAGMSTRESVWIDVRTIEEYNDDHIAGDLNMPLADIDVAEFSSMFSKDDEINLYCRSGNRAGQAKQILEAAGFTNVNNMGGIGDAREIRNLALQSSSE